jgi:hypothetical protein
VPDTTHDAPWPEQLRLGTGVQGWAMLDNVTVGWELWRQLNGFPLSISAEQALPGDEVAGKGGALPSSGGATGGGGKK